MSLTLLQKLAELKASLPPTIMLYHGTSSRRLPAIATNGLTPPVYLASEEEVAFYYAEVTAEEEGGSPILVGVKLDALKLQALEPDHPGLEEPLTHTIRKTEEEVWEEWEDSDQGWEDSLEIIGSLRYRRKIPGSDIDFGKLRVDMQPLAGSKARAGLPILTQPTVYHVGSKPGTPGSSRPGRSHFEGDALSVSTHPEAWERIARPLPGRTWELRGPGRFIDYHAFSDQQLSSLLQSRRDLVRPKTHYFAFMGEDEDGAVWEGPFTKKEEASAEVDRAEDVVPSVLWLPTPKLLSFSGVAIQGEDATADALLVIAGEQGLDGVWWEDELDPWAGSAPRGGLLRSRLSQWSIR